MELAKNGPLAPSALANAVSLSQATITGILDRLEKRQLVTRRRSTTDKRRVAVELTPRGQNLVSAAPPPLHQRFSEQLARLSADEQASIDRVLRDVVEMMEATELEVAPLLAAGPAGVGVGEVKQFLEADQPGEPGPGTKK
jgi:DNA-binding MarR family transcriptional regulator